MATKDLRTILEHTCTHAHTPAHPTQHTITNTQRLTILEHPTQHNTQILTWSSLQQQESSTEIGRNRREGYVRCQWQYMSHILYTVIGHGISQELLSYWYTQH